jgi:hypothetical protein
MKAGGDAWVQAEAVHSAFGQTLMCSPISKTGDAYTICAFKPSLFPITLVKAFQSIFIICGMSISSLSLRVVLWNHGASV